MIILKKLFFLYCSNANKYIYLNFIFTKLKNFFLKKKIKLEKKKHLNFLKRKLINHDYF